MTEAAKAAKRAYHTDWQRRNRDKTKVYEERYWENVVAKMAMEDNENGKGYATED